MRGPRRRSIKTVKESTLMVTVDIAVASNTGYCATVDGRDIKPFKFDDSREGFEKFWHMVVATKSRFACDEIVAGYESTGPMRNLSPSIL
jgi:hypothetical protein